MSDKNTLCMTIRDVADELRLSENYTRLLVKKGEIPSRRIGGAIRVLRSDLLEYLGVTVEPEGLQEGEPDPNAECLARFADRWRLNTIKR